MSQCPRSSLQGCLPPCLFQTLPAGGRDLVAKRQLGEGEGQGTCPGCPSSPTKGRPCRPSLVLLGPLGLTGQLTDELPKTILWLLVSGIWP